MRELVVAAVALVVGLLVGGVVPRAEVRRLEADAIALKARDCEKPRLGRELAQAFQGRPAIPEAEGAPSAAVEEEAPAGDPAPSADPPPDEPAEAPQSIEAMRTAMDLRRAQARAALVEDADPSDAQLDDIDAAIEDMNADLRDVAEDFVERFGDGREPSRRELMGFAADTLDIVIATDDRLNEALRTEQREALEEGALDPFSYLDPSLLELLDGLDR